MTRGDLLRAGLTTNYSLLSIKILMILHKIGENDERFSLSEQEKEELSEAKILVDKMTAWSKFIEGVDKGKDVTTEKEGYVAEGMALCDIISGGYPEAGFLASSFFDGISRSLWLLIGDFSLDSSKLEELHIFFDRFQKELSSINKAERYGVNIP